MARRRKTNSLKQNIKATPFLNKKKPIYVRFPKATFAVFALASTAITSLVAYPFINTEAKAQNTFFKKAQALNAAFPHSTVYPTAMNYLLDNKGTRNVYDNDSVMIRISKGNEPVDIAECKMSIAYDANDNPVPLCRSKFKIDGWYVSLEYTFGNTKKVEGGAQLHTKTTVELTGVKRRRELHDERMSTNYQGNAFAIPETIHAKVNKRLKAQAPIKGQSL